MPLSLPFLLPLPSLNYLNGTVKKQTRKNYCNNFSEKVNENFIETLPFPNTNFKKKDVNVRSVVQSQFFNLNLKRVKRGRILECDYKKQKMYCSLFSS